MVILTFSPACALGETRPKVRESALEEQRNNPAITDNHIIFIVLNLQIGAGDNGAEKYSAPRFTG